VKKPTLMCSVDTQSHIYFCQAFKRRTLEQEELNVSREKEPDERDRAAVGSLP
jgi:hypothetical protein